MPEYKTDREIEIMRDACRIVAEVHDVLERHIAPGVTTAELDGVAEEYIRSCGAQPAFKGYRMGNNTFPAFICTSIDDVVVHGIPSNQKLAEGEIISIDVGTYYQAYYGDGA